MVSGCRYFSKFFERFPGLKTFLLHFGLCVCVVVYILAGAHVIRNIEAVKVEQPILQSNSETAVVYEYRASEHNSTDPVASNSKTKHPLSRSRKCVIHAIASLSSGGQCDIRTQNFFDNAHQCYADDLNTSLQRFLAEEYTKSLLANAIHRPRSKATAYRETYKDWEYWTLKDSIIFCFTLITTIGYGHVAPETTAGRLYFLRSWCRFFRSSCLFAIFSCNFHRNSDKTTRHNESPSEKEHLTGEPVMLLLAFALYIVAGSLIFSFYEPNMDFVKAIYFNFITLMTIGLGDVVPQNQKYLVITLIYCTVGLALTTCAVETGADYLRKLHYFGRKINEVENLQIWFGSKRLTVKQLVRSMGDQFELPAEKLDKLNLDYFVEQAIQVESGHMTTLRNEEDSLKPESTTNIYSPTDGDIIYIDEDEKQKRRISK
uniref:Potassium channel domain-containing protein n=1 Tax=Ditylenchus dipsaci TaxID=166011 RepID=A0A915DF69_9BILA